MHLGNNLGNNSRSDLDGDGDGVLILPVGIINKLARKEGVGTYRWEEWEGYERNDRQKYKGRARG